MPVRSRRTRASLRECPRQGDRTARQGMTLIEVIVALVILVICVVALTLSVARFASASRSMQARGVAGELVADRLEEVKSAANYVTLDTAYAKTETSIAGYPGFIRQTTISRIGGQDDSFDDYKIVTVTVTSPQLSAPSTKSTVIAAF